VKVGKALYSALAESAPLLNDQLANYPNVNFILPPPTFASLLGCKSAKLRSV
jgi:hypothetical protein